MNKDINSDLLIDKAILFATEAHKGKRRKGTPIPYILHPLEVGKIVSSMTTDTEVIVAAILHDTVEDCDYVTNELISAEFGPRVAELVKWESENKREQLDPRETWEIRKKETLDELKMAPTQVKMITVADKLSNIRDMYFEEQRLGDELWKRFNQSEKKMHAWYYFGILSATTELRECFMWQELKRFVELVFGEEDETD